MAAVKKARFFFPNVLVWDGKGRERVSRHSLSPKRESSEVRMRVPIAREDQGGKMKGREGGCGSRDLFADGGPKLT